MLPEKPFKGCSSRIPWKPGSGYPRILELGSQGNTTGRLRLHLEHDDWPQLRVIQLLISDDCTDQADAERRTSIASPSPNIDLSAPLEPIPEETTEDLAGDTDHADTVGDYLHHIDPEMQEILNNLPNYSDLLVTAEGEPVSHDDLMDRMPLTLLTAPAEELILAEPIDNITETHVELGVSSAAANMMELSDVERRPGHNEIVLLQMGHNTVRQVVVQRDDDILTPDQLKSHWAEVRKAMLKELQTWCKLKCFSRRPRKGARNVIDVRWVIKFKWEVPTSDAEGSQSGNREAAKPVRTIRARLTVRGFKDHEKNDIDRYAGTSSRISQKLIVSEAVRNHWPILSADISKAFLQGVTYEELAKLTGEPVREVNFYLPASDIPLLRQLPGFEDFDPQTEVLHCDNPGTGLADAPRAFSIKLRGATEDKCQMVSS